MLLRIVIIEDEPASARNLQFHLQQLQPEIDVVAILPGIEQSVKWFAENKGGYELIFMDIRLGDGISFDIFKHVKIDKPVIFLTAFDEYALKAFKANGIDYILKPFDTNELQRALYKYRQLKDPYIGGDIDKLRQVIDTGKNGVSGFRQSFLVHFRNKLIPLAAGEIVWFYTANEIVYACTTDERKLIIDDTLEALQQQLDPTAFFRANRQFIIQRKYITEVDFYFNGRLSLKINPAPIEKIIISKARVPEFKLWMNN
jgi:two-component system, LytTR family, response regulator LytT